MWFLDDLLKPVGRNIGKAVGSFLAGQGVAADDISILVAAVPVLLGVVFDLVVRRVL